MSSKHRRYSLKAKEAKQIVTQVSMRLKIDLEALVGSKVNVETVEAEFGEVFLIDGKPVLFKLGTEVLPTLVAGEILKLLPKAVVDMGAIPYVCNGADVMAPGVVRYEGVFGKGDVVLIVDVKHDKPLAVGEVLFGSEEVKSIKKGAVIKSRHYVSDKIWNFAKTLID